MDVKKERLNRIYILEETKKAIAKEDMARLKELSNRTIHSASIIQDDESIILAIITYSLSKIIQKKQLEEFKSWPKFLKKYIDYLGKAKRSLEENNPNAFRKYLKLMRKEISNLSGNLKNYIKDVFKKASINKASKIYEHGISMEKTAELLGITLWELAEYAGQSPTLEKDIYITIPPTQRIKTVLELFK